MWLHVVAILILSVCLCVCHTGDPSSTPKRFNISK